jgi:transposase
VRVVDVFVDQLDLGKLGFEGVEPAITGRPSYHPSTLLKIYIYGLPQSHSVNAAPVAGNTAQC